LTGQDAETPYASKKKEAYGAPEPLHPPYYQGTQATKNNETYSSLPFLFDRLL